MSVIQVSKKCESQEELVSVFEEMGADVNPVISTGVNYSDDRRFVDVAAILLDAMSVYSEEDSGGV